MKAYIGIDNGVTGSLAYIGKHVIMVPTPVFKQLSYTKKKANITRIDFERLERLFTEWGNLGETALVLLERPYVNPKGIKATLSAVRSLEATLIALERFNLPFQYVDSREWQKPMLPSGIKGGVELKASSKDIGLRLFPHLREVIEKQKDADSLLIAEWARREGL